MPGRARTARRSYHHGNLRQGLVDEALATIRAEGVDALTLRDIGARLGVSRTALYRHFADKRALLAAVATEGFRMLRRSLVEAWEENGRGKAGFRAMGFAYVHFALRNPSHYRVMFGGFVEADAPDSELAREGKGAFQALVDALVSLQEDRLVLRDDPLVMATYVWSLVHGIAMLSVDRQFPEPDLDALLGYAFKRLRTGIRPRAKN